VDHVSIHISMLLRMRRWKTELGWRSEGCLHTIMRLCMFVHVCACACACVCVFVFVFVRENVEVVAFASSMRMVGCTWVYRIDGHQDDHKERKHDVSC
jgi:hypothetical protein